MTSEIITKQFKRGMTVEQIATLHSISTAHVEGIVEGLVVEREIKGDKPKRGKGVPVDIDFKQVEQLVDEGFNLPAIAKKLDVKYSTLVHQINKRPELKKRAGEAKRKTPSLTASQEVAVTTESDGFAENYTIAHMTKEEVDMTEAIAEVKQETEERNEPNDKWVHFVANQIENARVKTKFDVVQEGKKFIKRTEVRFVIEEVL